MDGADSQAIGSSSQLPCKPEAILIDKDVGREDFENSEFQRDNCEDGDNKVETKTESEDYEYRVVAGVTCLVKRVRTSRILEGGPLSCQVSRNNSSDVTTGECSTSLRVDTLTSDVRTDEDTSRLPHDRRLFRLERNEDGVESVETFEDASVVVRQNVISKAPGYGLLSEDFVCEISNEKVGPCSQDSSARPTSQSQLGAAEVFEEDKDGQVVFERNLSFGNRESDPEMDENIWQSLPEDVADKILLWLPVASCARFRPVCKRWLNLMKSEGFFQMHSQNAAHETWILSFADRSPDLKHEDKYEGQIFDPVSNRTFKLEFPSLPEGSVPVAAAGGLVCFCRDLNDSGEDGVCFYVCNPITKAWKIIPSPCSRVSIVTLVVDTEASFMSYKLYVVCEASEVRWLWMGVLDHSTKEYDSKLNRWIDVGDVHSSEQFRGQSVFNHGKVHLLSSEFVHALDVQEGNWMMMSVPAYASCASLLEREGRLLVVGDIVNHNVFHLPGMKSYVGIAIWEYDPVYKDWNEVTRMPEAMVENFSYSSFSCVIVGDLVYLFSRRYITPQIVVYSFSQQLWSQVADWCEGIPFKVFTFNPRLDSCA
ncbi:F-box only protein 6 [Physcomitrium patens]|nr:F-box only protein 6-like [Physcomitrium patens]XP_024389577.1 F-box only protein 6-like [Physcomitrium patens]XP_024389578.1 F-box only protein 6-like [Physcomitrium patens]XP_024389579.1 F-box only protein 6-like [Physcomitrium patens]XP_024389580.1 F-box only protein 6-like [Physcomitrium patens]PNR44863.1 hypothetical protein PHYPA_014633 [Physcomitrium patens]|eukprot:XP_024389575.1 F-box only protein 6-like [Physcomitrella patens]